MDFEIMETTDNKLTSEKIDKELSELKARMSKENFKKCEE
nr:MAG TPA: hypothetical protein [Bacteriophage sp.]